MQDARGFSGLGFLGDGSLTVLGVCLLRISGLLFRRGFMRKDIILSRFGTTRVFFGFWRLVILTLSGTMLYSVRLFIILSRGGSGPLLVGVPSKLRLLFRGVLVLLGVFGG